MWLGRDGFFYCDSKQSIADRQAYIEAERERKLQECRQQLNEERQRAENFNSKIKLPVQWTVGQKDVLSGLTEYSRGDGRNKRTVEHILLKEDLQEGRLKRKADDFLCTSMSGSNGKRWASTACLSYDGDSKPYEPKVTCLACLKAAQRWIKD